MRLSKSNKTLITGIVLGSLLAIAIGLLVNHMILTTLGLRGPFDEGSTTVEDRSDDVGCAGDVRLGQLCAEGVGTCRVLGSFICLGREVECSAIAGLPVVEICDGVDNNCDGLVDEDCDGAQDLSPNATTAAAGAACGNVGERTLTITIDNARLDALYGACPEGRRIGTWDQCGTFLHSALRASSFTVRGVVPTGFYRTAVMCGDTFYTWPIHGFSSAVDSQLAEPDTESARSE